MKYRKVICVVFAMLFFVGCGTPKNTTPDYNAFYESCKPNKESELISALHAEGNYVLLYYGGLGTSLELYKISIDGGTITTIGIAYGDVALSGGISINHLETGGKHIYFGTLSATHWDPASNTVTDLDWDVLRMTSGTGMTCVSQVKTGSVYLITLNAPLSEFEALDAEGNVLLDFETYQCQGYPVTEVSMRNP